MNQEVKSFVGRNKRWFPPNWTLRLSLIQVCRHKIVQQLTNEWGKTLFKNLRQKPEWYHRYLEQVKGHTNTPFITSQVSHFCITDIRESYLHHNGPSLPLSFTQRALVHFFQQLVPNSQLNIIINIYTLPLSVSH